MKHKKDISWRGSMSKWTSRSLKNSKPRSGLFNKASVHFGAFRNGRFGWTACMGFKSPTSNTGTRKLDRIRQWVLLKSSTLLGTNIVPWKVVNFELMIFLYPRWDMLVSGSVGPTRIFHFGASILIYLCIRSIVVSKLQELLANFCFPGSSLVVVLKRPRYFP